MSKFNPYDHLNIVLNSDGTLSRLLEIPKIDPKPEPSQGDPIASMDVPLKPENKTGLRLYRPAKLPSNDNSIARLPIILYFHGGGGILFHVADPVPHSKCSELATDIPAIVVSVEYRLAPEHRLPAQYEDAMDSIHWVKNQFENPEGHRWLKDYGDISRCYLSGTDSGGNIVFHAALRTIDIDISPMKIAGVIMNQPMFSGKYRTKSELKFATDQLLPLPVIDLMWELMLPAGTDRDHRYCNPMVNGPHMSKLSKLSRCLVIGFGGDPMVDRQQELVTTMMKAGVPVEAKFDDVGFHGIDFIDSKRAAAVLSIMKEFVI